MRVVFAVLLAAVVLVVLLLCVAFAPSCGLVPLTN